MLNFNFQSTRALTEEEQILEIIKQHSHSYIDDEYLEIIKEGEKKDLPDDIEPERDDYWLPYSRGEKYQVTQSYYGGFSHVGKIAYSIDFAMEEGTDILAVKGGKIIGIEQSQTKSCMSGGCLGNYIVIKHDEDSTSMYYHLKPESIPEDVELNGYVQRGQKIAESGNTGWSTGAHLHFTLMTTPEVDSVWGESKPIMFEEFYFKKHILIFLYCF